jgi:hypothetical protein
MGNRNPTDASLRRDNGWDWLRLAVTPASGSRRSVRRWRSTDPEGQCRAPAGWDALADILGLPKVWPPEETE